MDKYVRSWEWWEDSKKGHHFRRRWRKRSLVFFSGKKIGDAISCRPEVTPTSVTPLCTWTFSDFFHIYRRTISLL